MSDNEQLSVAELLKRMGAEASTSSRSSRAGSRRREDGGQSVADLVHRSDESHQQPRPGVKGHDASHSTGRIMSPDRSTAEPVAAKEEDSFSDTRFPHVDESRNLSGRSSRHRSPAETESRFGARASFDSITDVEEKAPYVEERAPYVEELYVAEEIIEEPQEALDSPDNANYTSQRGHFEDSSLPRAVDFVDTSPDLDISLEVAPGVGSETSPVPNIGIESDIGIARDAGMTSGLDVNPDVNVPPVIDDQEPYDSFGTVDSPPDDTLIETSIRVADHSEHDKEDHSLSRGSIEQEPLANHGTLSFVAQLVAAAVIGALVFVLFEFLWSRPEFSIVTSVLAVALTAGLVALVGVLQESRDDRTKILAGCVGLCVTFGPLILNLLIA